jgi:hypothetical protein
LGSGGGGGRRCGGGGSRAGPRSLDAAAEGDAVADGELADLYALVGGERLVEHEHEVAVVANVLAHGRVVGEHDGAVPQRVVVADEAAQLHQLEQPLVVVEVVVLIGVHEDEVEGAVVLLLHARREDSEITRGSIPGNRPPFLDGQGQGEGSRAAFRTSAMRSSRTGSAGPSRKSILWATPAFSMQGRPSS